MWAMTLFLCTQSPAKTSLLACLPLCRLTGMSSSSPKQVNLIREGNGLFLTCQDSQVAYLVMSLFGLNCCFDVLRSLSILLIRSRNSVSFTDYSSVARSTCGGKEGIIETDLRGTALSGCWTGLLRFKIWPCIYWAPSTSPGLCQALQIQGCTVYEKQ